jgi:hypothetical protein
MYKCASLQRFCWADDIRPSQLTGNRVIVGEQHFCNQRVGVGWQMACQVRSNSPIHLTCSRVMLESYMRATSWWTKVSRQLTAMHQLAALMQVASTDMTASQWLCIQNTVPSFVHSTSAPAVSLAIMSKCWSTTFVQPASAGPPAVG